jgi:glycosyltransferase involved in cell wall biosynthesis
MKILQLISSYGFFGSENVVFELSRELESRNIDNTIGVFDNSHNRHTEVAHYAGEHDIKTRIFRCEGKMDFGTVCEITKFVRKNDVSIIHAHGYKSNIYGFLAAKVLKKPIVSTCHNWIAEDLKTRAYYWLDKSVLRRFDKVVAVSEEIEDELLRLGITEDSIALIQNGIDISKFDRTTGTIRTELNINEKTKVIGTVARLTPEKGLACLLEAFKKVLHLFPNSICMIVGDGSLRAELTRKAAELGVGEKVLLTGVRTDLPRVYSAMDIFVLPSLKEGLPMVILEAMASRKPVIATNVGAIPRMIKSGKEGILVNPGNVEELSEAIIVLVKDRRVSETLAQNAQKKVVQQFSSKIMCGRYVEIYEEILQRRDKTANQ